MRRALATLLELVHTRVELVGVEIEEQARGAVTLLLWALVAGFCAAVAVLLLALTLVVAFWEHRLLAAALVTLAFAAGAVGAALHVRERLARRPRLFARTVDELRRDVEALDGGR